MQGWGILWSPEEATPEAEGSWGAVDLVGKWSSNFSDLADEVKEALLLPLSLKW